MRRFTTVAAVGITTVLAAFSVAEASPPTTDPSDETQASTTSEVSTTVAVTVEESPPSGTAPDTSLPPSNTTDTGATTVDVDAGTSAPDDVESSAAATSNPNQLDQQQTVVVTATVVADANTGSNTVVDDTPGQGGSQLPAEIVTGDATAVGSDDQTVVVQGADVVLTGSSTANVVQIALTINIGVALANSGFNIFGASHGGAGTSGAIATGDASATGLDIEQYITQAAREDADADSDAHASQVAISLWLGLATANSGTNGVTGSGATGSGGAIASGGASATGNDSVTEIGQYAEILGMDQSTISVTQRATVLNVGFALANSGLNDVSGAAGGLLTATDSDDDAVATELFAMLLPALLQSYGYGPAAGTIASGDATAVGNQSETFVKQVAMAAASGDGVVEIVQDVLVANMGAASANTGGNTLGSVRQLDAETADAVVKMAAFMSELLSLVQRSANSTTLEASSRGIEIPFQNLILRLDGSFEGLDLQVSDGAAQANVRQVSIVVSLGVSTANTGGNISSSETQQGASVNALQVGDALAVLALDEEGNVVGSGDANASNSEVVVICQRLNADDVDCLAPPTTTTPPTTTPGGPTTDPSTTVPGISQTSVPPSATTPGSSIPVNGFGHVPRGTLPATGSTTTPLAVGALGTFLAGTVLLLAARRRSYP